MIVEILEFALALLLIPALILYLLHHWLFVNYILRIFNPFWYLLQITSGVIVGIILLIPKIVYGLFKSLLVTVLFIAIGLIYATTFVVPDVGKVAIDWKQSLKYGLLASYITFQVRKMRGTMIKIVAEEDDRDLTFQEPERYYTKLEDIHQNAKDRLESGETVMSILLGAVLLVAKVLGIKLLSTSIFGISVAILIEAWILIIAVSIIYRTTVLDYLAYSSDDEFQSLDEMDAALGYQRGVSLVGFIQGLMILVVLISAATSASHELIEDVLRANYRDEPWIPLAWEKLTD